METAPRPGMIPSRAFPVCAVLLLAAQAAFAVSGSGLPSPAHTPEPSPGPQYPGSARVDCYDRARHSLNLSRDDSLALCRYAQSLAPVECFERAQTRLLDREELIELCRTEIYPYQYPER